MASKLITRIVGNDILEAGMVSIIDFLENGVGENPSLRCISDYARKIITEKAWTLRPETLGVIASQVEGSNVWAVLPSWYTDIVTPREMLRGTAVAALAIETLRVLLERERSIQH